MKGAFLQNVQSRSVPSSNSGTPGGSLATFLYDFAPEMQVYVPLEHILQVFV
jgi:hypothetical protein